jgi:phage N-6-adenine-methyltransferase
MTIPIHYRSESVEWSTPTAHFAKWEAEFGPFDLDPAATAENTKAKVYFTRETDGLAQDWSPYKRIWLNPPYQKPELACTASCTKKRCIKRGGVHNDRRARGRRERG